MCLPKRLTREEKEQERYFISQRVFLHLPTWFSSFQSIKSRHCLWVSVTFTLLPPKLVEGSCDRLCCKFKHAFSSFAFLQVVLRNSPQIFKWDDGGYREWLPHFTVSPFFLLAIVILCVFATTSQLFTKYPHDYSVVLNKLQRSKAA